MIDLMFKGLGFDPVQVLKQAQEINTAFHELKATTERQEILLRAICFKLEIEIPMTDTEKEFAAKESQRFLNHDPETTSPLLFAAVQGGRENG